MQLATRQKDELEVLYFRFLSQPKTKPLSSVLAALGLRAPRQRGD
jgi:hypothetical protein